MNEIYGTFINEFEFSIEFDNHTPYSKMAANKLFFYLHVN